MEEGEEVALDGFDARKASSGMMSPMETGGIDEIGLRGEDHGARYRSSRGGRGRGGSGRGRGTRRRKFEDEDEASEIFEDMKGPQKRRKRGVRKYESAL